MTDAADTGPVAVGRHSTDAPSAAPPAVGRPAPEFVLTDTHGSPVRLSALRGAPVLLVFVPFAFSRVCTGELDQLRDDQALLTAAGAHLLVVSCDPVPALRAWAEQERYPFDLLSDFWPHGEVATAFGVFDAERGRAERGSFLLDADGVLRWSVVGAPGVARDPDGYRRALAALGGPPTDRTGTHGTG